MIVIVISAGLLIVCLIDLLLILLWKIAADIETDDKQVPISILIAARNESANIERCLSSLVQQNYPAGLIQILVGDDSSRDKTYEKANKFLSRYPQIDSSVVRIENQVTHQKGKANVLAQLAQNATGDYYMITDADMALPATWIQTMVNTMPAGGGIVTGVTISSKHQFQSLDWMFALAMVKVLADLGKPVTAMGNNMAISRSAYEAVGGYEQIPFSITEDLELFKSVDKAGFDAIQLYNDRILGDSQPVRSFYELLQQRKRWMTGALGLAWPIVVLLFIQAIYFPLMIALLFLQWQWAVIIMSSKMLLQAVFLKKASNSLKLKISFGNLFFYEVHSWLVGFGTLIFYFIPISVKWKGRKY